LAIFKSKKKILVTSNNNSFGVVRRIDNITNIDINFFYEFLERILQIYDGKKEILVDTYIAFSVNIWRICSSNARNCSCTFHLYNLLE